MNKTNLWDAINHYCVACGGSLATCIYGNVERQRVVCETTENARRKVADAARELLSVTGEIDDDRHRTPRGSIEMTGPEIRVQCLAPGVSAPRHQTEGAAGLDLCSAAPESTISPGARALIGTGISVEIPPGYEGQVRPRSGLAWRYGIGVLNSPGTIDSDYRGEIGVILVNHSEAPYTVRPGDRIAQLVIAPVARVAVKIVDSLTGSSRGSGGFGSTG